MFHKARSRPLVDIRIELSSEDRLAFAQVAMARNMTSEDLFRRILLRDFSQSEKVELLRELGPERIDRILKESGRRVREMRKAARASGAKAKRR